MEFRDFICRCTFKYSLVDFIANPFSGTHLVRRFTMVFWLNRGVFRGHQILGRMASRRPNAFCVYERVAVWIPKVFWPTGLTQPEDVFPSAFFRDETVPSILPRNSLEQTFPRAVPASLLETSQQSLDSPLRSQKKRFVPVCDRYFDLALTKSWIFSRMFAP